MSAWIQIARWDKTTSTWNVYRTKIRLLSLRQKHARTFFRFDSFDFQNWYLWTKIDLPAVGRWVKELVQLHDHTIRLALDIAWHEVAGRALTSVLAVPWVVHRLSYTLFVWVLRPLTATLSKDNTSLWLGGTDADVIHVVLSGWNTTRKASGKIPNSLT